ncbi:3-dehydroquinate synthase [Clostridia bacterium]|nr:3-dehydroquinate synthase [Clostridia bacterium]
MTWLLTLQYLLRNDTYMDFSTLPLETLIDPAGLDCGCGRTHRVSMEFLKIGSGAVGSIPDALDNLGVVKPFIVCDSNTYEAAWRFVEPVLLRHGIPFTLYQFPMERVEPDEHAVGSLTMAFDTTCDCVMSVGSGVVSDCCRVLAYALRIKQIAIATAPSMDGYASNSASMIRQRIKVSLYCKTPAAIIADTDIIKDAPMRMLWAGLGDMLAKYVALCEWRISHLVTGEYYCENIAAMMRASLVKVVSAAPGLARRDEDAVRATVEGLILSGIAMSYAGISRPASGLEHYFSHIWEMMALERGTPYELHGIQVGIGTLLTLKLYDTIRTLKPNRATAEAFIGSFSDERWQAMIRRIFGQAADTMIQQEHTIFHKNDKATHSRRFNIIEARWDDILRIIDEELPPTDQIESLMRSLGMPMLPDDIGIGEEDTLNAFIGSRDIRDKYLTSSMLWDMGLLYDSKLTLPMLSS